MSFKASSFLSNTASSQKIAKDVADPEQRHYLIESQIRHGIPLQLRAMREGQGWTQATLAEKLGTTQNAISRLENPRTGKPTITTLERIAQVFDVALIVKFAPFSEFADSLSEMSDKSVSVPSYEEETRKPKEEIEFLSGNFSVRQAIPILSAYSEDAYCPITYYVTGRPLSQTSDIIDIGLYRKLYEGNSIDESFYVESKPA